MKKLTTMLLAVLFTGKLLMAQSVDEAKKSLYHGRTTTAKQAFEKLVADNPKNGEAVYWLGQTYLAMEDTAGARKVYQNALNSGVNEPLIWVGIGHLDLLAGKKDMARERFEAAITASTKKKKEDPDILNAIGRANADGPANVGDPAYAVEKLKRAAELAPNNPAIFTNLGINYIKLGSDHGGDAYEAYINALKADPNYAMAKFRLGKIFESQGNPDKYLSYYNDAVTGDPMFAPAYLELYEYYSNRDVNKAREYLEKYIANADKDCSTDYFYADYLFRAGKYQESLDKAKQMSAGQCANFPRLKVLYAYDYDRLGDFTQARANIEAYLSSLSPDQIANSKNIGTDYLFGASVLKKFEGGEETAISYLKQALNSDTVRAHRFQYMDTIAYLYKREGKMDERLNWLLQSFRTNPNPSNLDMYNIADAAINAGNLPLGDSMSKAYIEKYPTQEYGYVLLTRAAKAGDPNSSTGTAFDEVQRYIDYLKNEDSVKNASKIKYQYYYIASVAADKLKDYQKALDAINEILAIDPADTFGVQAKPVLEKAINPKGASSSGGKKKG